MSNEATSLTITVDKSHILMIGERLYEQSIELIRELVNNAYDADATLVTIHLSPDLSTITVEDNGLGMTPFEFQSSVLLSVSSNEVCNSRI